MTECSHLSDYGKWLCGNCHPVLILFVSNFSFTMLALPWIASVPYCPAMSSHGVQQCPTVVLVCYRFSRFRCLKISQIIWTTDYLVFSVQFCPDRVRGVQHCLAVFSSIQHRPAVFRCLVVPSCSTVSVSVQLRPDSTKCSTLFDIVQQCPTASSSVQQCTRPSPCVFWLHLSFSQWTYILLLSS